MPSGVYAAIFDLDGVLTSTSARHEQSWADAARAFNIPVTEAALRATRSIPRASSLAALLAHAGVHLPSIDRDAVMAFKNQRYKELIAGLQPTDAFTGARAALERVGPIGAGTIGRHEAHAHHLGQELVKARDLRDIGDRLGRDLRVELGDNGGLAGGAHQVPTPSAAFIAPKAARVV